MLTRRTMSYAKLCPVCKGKGGKAVLGKIRKYKKCAGCDGYGLVAVGDETLLEMYPYYPHPYPYPPCTITYSISTAGKCVGRIGDET